MLNKTRLITAVLCFLVFTSLSAAEPAKHPAEKPLAPVRVSVQPILAGVMPDTIQPGDTIEIGITAVSAIASQDMRIDVNLERGATLVSGETAWKGRAAKDTPITLTITVRAPDTGTGRVRARVSLPADRGPRFSSEAVFDLGPAVESRPGQEPMLKKNRKGRTIIEYQ